jgi:cytochrome P450
MSLTSGLRPHGSSDAIEAPIPPITTRSPASGARVSWRRLLTRQIDVLSLIPHDAFAHEFSEFRVLWQHYVLLNDPDAVQHVLVDHADRYMRAPSIRRSFKRVLGDSLITTEGETRRRHRRIMAPALTPKSVLQHAPLVSEVTVALIKRWADLRDGTAIDLIAALREVTIALIARAMLSTNCREEVATVQASVPRYARAMRQGFLDLLADGMASLPVWCPRWMLPRFDRLVEGLVARRRSAGAGTADDLLCLLLRAQANGDMSLREVVDHAAHIFFVGHDAPEQAMAWAWYLLSQHPTEEARLHAELDRVLAGRLPTADDLQSLPYTRMVMEEVMRLYPPVPLLGRQASVDDQVNGRRLPKGSLVLIVPWVLHRHARIWDRADIFDPERFSPARARGRHPYSYIPFGAGPGACLGASFAMMETMLLLAGLAQHFRLRLAPGQRIEPIISPTLRPHHGMTMIVERRVRSRPVVKKMATR